MKTFLRIIVATIIGMIAGMVAIMYDATDNVVFTVTIMVDAAVAVLIGVFDVPDESKTAMRKRMKRQNRTKGVQKAA